VIGKNGRSGPPSGVAQYTRGAMRSGIGLVAFVVLVLCGSPDAHAELDSGVALKLAIWEQGKPARTQLVAEAIIKIGTLPSCDVQLHDKIQPASK